MASPLTEPSPSPSPSPSPLSRPSPPKQIVPIATRPAMPRLLPRLSKAGLDSESELSELSEDDETEQKAPESAPLEQGEEEEEEDEDEDEENQDDKADDDSTTRSRSRAHRKKGSLLPEPMWGWAYKKRTKEGTANHAPSSSKPAGTHAKNGTASEPAFNEEEEEEEEPEEEDEEDEAFALETKSPYTRPISTSLSHSGSKNGLLPTPITHPVNGDDEPEEEDATEDEEDEHATEAGTEHGVVADAEEAEDDDGEDDQEADGSSSLDRSRPPTPDDQAILPLPIPPTIPKSPLSSPEPDSSGIHSHPPKIIDGDVDMDGELDGDPDVEIDDNSERDPDQELDAEMDQDADPEQEAEVDHEQEPDQEVDAETEHDLSSAHRAEALDVLTAIEIKFAELRERLYLEKMEDLQVEEELVLKNIHPEMIHLQNELEKRRERRKELADKKRKYEEEAVELKRRVDGNGILAWWKHERDELQSEMMADTNRKRRRLERERRLVERPLPCELFVLSFEDIASNRFPLQLETSQIHLLSRMHFLYRRPSDRSLKRKTNTVFPSTHSAIPT
ncbi:hypothetical protein SISNIDRAFT_258049 [Sistotremastrum niveocremeum HHB9708]|uniref:Sds3-like-domain-containing protein n=1 Tax=Sistotremastrum niveocremeum HHB9708 TaxID=1314777 RepID=A0A164PD08_9AGAM|nr:hypothetical protein SISNIDRAFT_258049 [Sistotremastrum niveocremeum HHB9708]